jgi:hypothetical protein
MTDVLHLTLHRQWFDAIASGEKTTEYRAITDFWTKRLLDRHYDEVHFRNGYSFDKPWMRVEFKGLSSEVRNGKLCYAIKLGRVLGMKNYP